MREFYNSDQFIYFVMRFYGILLKSHYYKCVRFILNNKLNFAIDAVPVNKNTNLYF
jgi:hypothetical protein